jgi:O-antigen/teichoic acid export membrane protein
MFYKIKEFIRKFPLTYNVLVAVSSAINFATLIIFGRVFSVKDYGIITTLQAVVTNLGVLVIPLQVILCKNIAEGKSGGREVNNAISLYLIVNCILIFGMLVGANALIGYLHFKGVMVYGAFVILVLVNNLFVLLNGVLQGRQLFIQLGFCTIILYLFKLALGTVFGIIGYGYYAVIIGMLIAELFSILYILARLKGVYDTDLKYKFYIYKEGVTYFGWTLILYAVVSLYLNNGDLILGNMYCSEEQIGLYSVTINLAKISYFLIAAPIATVIMPKMAQCYEKATLRRQILIKAEIITLVLTVAYGMVFLMLSKFLIVVLYGEAYLGANKYVFPCVIFSIVLGEFWVFYQYVVVTSLLKSFSVITSFIGILYGVGILYFKPDISVIPIGMSVVMILSVACTILFDKLVNENV